MIAEVKLRSDRDLREARTAWSSRKRPCVCCPRPTCAPFGTAPIRGSQGNAHLAPNIGPFVFACRSTASTSRQGGKTEVTHTGAVKVPHRAGGGRVAGSHPPRPAHGPVFAARMEAGNSPPQGTPAPLPRGPRRRGTTAPSEPCAASIFPLTNTAGCVAETRGLAETKPALQQNFLRVCFEPAVRYAAEIDPRISRISAHELVGFTLAAGQSLHCWAALFPRGAVNLLFFPGGDVVSWECPQNTWWVSSSPVSAIFNKPGRWPLPALTPLLFLSIWVDDPDIALLPVISPCCRLAAHERRAVV